MSLHQPPGYRRVAELQQGAGVQGNDPTHSEVSYGKNSDFYAGPIMDSRREWKNYLIRP